MLSSGFRGSDWRGCHDASTQKKMSFSFTQVCIICLVMTAVFWITLYFFGFFDRNDHDQE